MIVLVTGGVGFIGSHLVDELANHDHDVVGVDREDGDLLEPGVIDQLLDEYTPDICVHLAAKVGRLFGEDDPSMTVLDNAGMTALVAKACGERDVRVAYTSTSEAYGDCGDRTAYEDAQALLSVLNPFPGVAGCQFLPHNIYGLSKRWGEEVCRLYAPRDLTVLRLSMPYGPGHPPGVGRAALTNFLWNAKCGRDIYVHRDSERSWCWVGDTVRGIRLVLEKAGGGAFNVGRDDNALPMRQVAEMACEMVGAPKSLIQEVDPPERQTVVKRLSTHKLRRLGWAPEVELDEGMRRTLDWLEAGEWTT